MLIVLLPVVTAAQEPVKSFDQLNPGSGGQHGYVTDAQGREVEGRISELHEESITLDSDGPTTLQADNVRLVQKRDESIGKAMLWGLLIGGAAGAAAWGSRFELQHGRLHERRSRILLGAGWAPVSAQRCDSHTRRAEGSVPRTRRARQRAPLARASDHAAQKGVAVAYSF